MINETKTASLSSLQSKAQAELLDDIDRLRSEGIGNFAISLPQLIVCGDQSSGKSSVLEALSRVQFPTKDGLCTRFATEVILRKTKTTGVSISIIPGKTRSPEEREKLVNFNPPHTSLEEFPALVDAAQDAMGISKRASAFSDDRLRVEISGPEFPQLTIVDLPGLIHAESKRQTAEDVELVKSLVQGYMKDQRSIVLAVVTAKNDISNQIVLRMAREFDHPGLRTLGIITKPDTLIPGSESESHFVELARNTDVIFRLGWHVLKNRDFNTKDISLKARDDSEQEFLTQGVWQNLPRSIVGIDELRRRLSNVLLEHIRTELPALVDDVEKSIDECHSRLDSLGASRATVKQQRVYLMNISQSFLSILKNATNGNYSGPFFGDYLSDMDYPKRLRAVIQNTNADFSKLMAAKGHQFDLVERDRCLSGFEKPGTITRSAYHKRVQTMMRKNRGRELPGMFNPLLVGHLFFEQAKPWRNLVQKHVHESWAACQTLLDLGLSSLTDEKTCVALESHVVSPFMRNKLRQLNMKVNELLKPYEDGHPITYNHYFTDIIQKTRVDRHKRAITDKFYNHLGYPDNGHRPNELNYGSGFSVPSLMSALTVQTEEDMEEFACLEIVDCMEAYYKVALKVLVDDIAILAIENCLVQELENVLSPAAITEMDDDLITLIAAESEESQNERELTTQKLKVLESALQACYKHVSRRICAFKLNDMAVGAKGETGQNSPLGINIHGWDFAKVPDLPLQPKPQAKAEVTERNDSCIASYDSSHHAIHKSIPFTGRSVDVRRLERDPT
ncbi:MAG: hypothetical protein M1834_005408 [Cirrosporium novae-zelandiae]|nr:MAG: hypothetical protein M1834_005408 [Cirrosporium novae-zelandiae]